MKWVEKSIGLEFKTDHFLMFFGNRNASLAGIQKEYSGIEFRFLKQIHSALCIRSEKAEVEADAHFTVEKKVALCIRTADCTPVLLANSETVCAVHAGWRGVFHNILSNSIELAFKSHLEDTYIAFGPHIQKDSFQVDPMLGNEFSLKFGKEFVFAKPHVPNKSYIDLQSILISQLNSKAKEYWASDEDTLTSKDYYSHRAEPENKGRNISFVTRL